MGSTFLADTDSIPSRHAVSAAKYCQDKNLQLAKAEIDQAILSDDEKNDAYTWFIHGFIYKEIYKQNESHIESERSRAIAVESLLKARSLSQDMSGTDNNDAALNYLASTYFRDAMLFADEISDPDDESADILFDAYKNLQTALNGGITTSNRYLEFLHAKGKRMMSLQSDDRCNEKLFLATRNIMLRILELNPNDCIAGYNLAITYYNTAVFSNDAVPAVNCYDEPERKSFLEISLSLLKGLEADCDGDLNTDNALRNVYIALGDTVAAEEYEKKITSPVIEKKY